MIPQREVNESIHEQTSSIYGAYEGDQEYARQPDVTPYQQMLSEGSEGKVYPPQSGSISMFYQFVIVFVISMVALFAFATLCLVFVGGTGGWSGFIAASITLLSIASTYIVGAYPCGRPRNGYESYVRAHGGVIPHHCQPERSEGSHVLGPRCRLVGNVGASLVDARLVYSHSILLNP